MTFPSPLQHTLESYERAIETTDMREQRAGAAVGSYESKPMTEFLGWGEDGCFVVATTGVVELEYAAIQKTYGAFDAPCRGTIELTGPDRLECIGRLTTQKVIEMKEGEARLAFITSRKGTVVADVIVRVCKNAVLLDIDINAVQQVCDHVSSYIVMEDVQIVNRTDSTHWIWCVGPQTKNISIEGVELHPLPLELLGIEGVAIMDSPENIHSVWEKLLSSGCKPLGWYALNMARVERSAPLFLIDFDTNNLPHETSLLSSRVRFDKGCYLGQEVIARMESLGKPKQQLVQIQMQSDDLPISGAQIWIDNSTSGTPAGVVTSSAMSPMGGAVPAVIAMVSKKCYAKGTTVFMHVGTSVVEGIVQPL
jgi:tRNA-modifying protein YgfZ